MATYYELMHLTHKERTGKNISVRIQEYLHKDEFLNSSELEKQALNIDIDSESETVSTAIGIIRWLLRNDESVKGKYTFRKKK